MAPAMTPGRRRGREPLEPGSYLLVSHLSYRRPYPDSDQKDCSVDAGTEKGQEKSG